MKNQPRMRFFKPVTAALVLAWLACGIGDSISTFQQPEDVRPQDSRDTHPPLKPRSVHLPSALSTPTGGPAYSRAPPTASRFPRPADGKLVIWAHGYGGTGPSSTVDTPIMRRYLLEKGYAWAATSYAKNYYDVSAGVEDTDALALNFSAIAAANNRTLARPSKIFITGVSMGGHVTAAAIDAEA